MKNEYIQIDITKNEVLDMFVRFDFIIVEAAQDESIVCLNPHCKDYEIGSNGSITKAIITADEYFLISFYCKCCDELTFRITS